MEKRNSNKSDDAKFAPKKKPFWTTATIATDVGREDLLAATFKEIIFHLISLIFLSIYIFSQIDSSEFYLVNAMKTAFQTDDKLNDVSSASDLWDYLTGPMMEAFYGPDAVEDYNNAKKKHDSKINSSVANSSSTTPYDGNLTSSSTTPYDGNLTSSSTTPYDGNRTTEVSTAIYIANENRVLGVPRIRQVRVTNSSCEIHGYFRRLFLTCYNKFSDRWEDRSQFGTEDSTAWLYSDASETKSRTYKGILTDYTGGGFYIDLREDLEGTMAILEQLQDHLWITRGTRAIFVDFSIYNANLNLFCISKLIFELLPSGGVKSSFQFSTAILTPFSGAGEWTLRILLYLFGLYALFCLFEEFREMMYFKGSYFTQFWNYIDHTVIILTCLLIIGTEYMRVKVKAYMNKIDSSPHVYGNLETPNMIYSLVRICGATAVFFVYLRTFKYLNFNRRMSQLNNTIDMCGKDILGFSVMFFVAYLAYAELGYLVFGSQVDGFRSFGQSMFTLLRTILGDFDYGEIRDANWVVAPIYFLSYIILVFFVLLNMFLAIINDTYADVKTDIALAPNEMEMTEYVSKSFKRMLRKIGFKIKQEAEKEGHLNTTVTKIRDALVKCTFNDREIEMYFTRYDISPLKSLTAEEVESFFEKFAQEDRARTAAQENVVTWKDFQKQDDKLVALENSLVTLGERIHELLRNLENIQGAQPRTFRP